MIQVARTAGASGASGGARSRRALLVDYLAEIDVACPVCGAGLRGAQDRCPSCGCALELRLDSEQARLGPWIVALMTAALPLGFYAIIGVLIGLSSILGAGGSSDVRLMILGLSCAVPQTIVLVAILRFRRLITARSRMVQWMIAAVVTLSSSALFAWVLGVSIG